MDKTPKIDTDYLVHEEKREKDRTFNQESKCHSTPMTSAQIPTYNVE